MTKASKIGNQIKKAIDEFGSLEAAKAHLLEENLALKEKNQLLLQQNDGLKQGQQQLINANSSLTAKNAELAAAIQLIKEKIQANSPRLDLTDAMMVMIARSPSATQPLDTLINSLTRLKEKGWPVGKQHEDLKSYFISTVMGDYLKSFHCDKCGISFIVNKDMALRTVFTRYYYCPVCGALGRVKPDDSFMTAMVTGKQLETVHYAVNLKEENDQLQPLKLFLNYPCEFCKKPITEWTDNNVKMGMQGHGWAHNECWNSDKGRTRGYAIILEEVIKIRRHGHL